MLSKTSKGRYLDCKRASFASQKVVNRKPIYALFVFKIRFFFTKFILFAKAIEKRIRWKCKNRKVLLLPCLQTIQSLFICYFVYLFPLLLFLCYSVFILSCLQLNSLSCQLVTLSTKETFLCYFVFILSCLCFSVTLS